MTGFRSSILGRRQNTSVFSLNYGLTDRIELGINTPLVKIFNDRDSMLGNPSGIGRIKAAGGVCGFLRWVLQNP